MNKAIFQKILAIALILVIPIFILINFTLLRSKRNLSTKFSLEFINKNEYLTEKSFVFILYNSSNDTTFTTQNLFSIFNQKYDNYRVILISDQMRQIEECKKNAAKKNKSHLLTILQTTDNEPAFELFKKAVTSCQDNEIIIHINANDWLAHDNVLAILNNIYFSSENVWLAYSQYTEFPSYKKGINNNSKKNSWLLSYFKTYYVGLFKQTYKELSFDNAFNQNNLDLYMMPMAKISKNHIHYIEEPLYVHNDKK